MALNTTLNLIHANFFFVDIVGLSDPSMSTKTQIKKIEALNKSIAECDAYKTMPKDSLLILPTGDGMAIGFLQGPELPLKLAMELQKKLNEYNKAKIPSEIVQVRVGLHSGNVFVVNDIQGNKNIWGPGLIIARRVMDFGDEDHILLSSALAESLHELSDEYLQFIKPVHDFVLKHGKSMLIYSAYGDGFGNPEHPSKGAALGSKLGEFIKRNKTTLYPFVEVALTITDTKSMKVHYKRTYEIKNTSDEPIYNVLHGIATDVEKHSINDLNVKAYDEDNRDLKITSISVDEPYQKEFTTGFNRPVLKDEPGRYYIMEYEVEEPNRYFENAFLINCQKLVLKIEYPINDSVQEPVLYEVNQETEEKKKSNISGVIRESGETNVIRWAIEGITKGQNFRIEW
ncbi:MAG TPA: adenylate/guanylate cyclase domain-containing protein [Candidatus Nitrosotalea sp.]|nr:adenylate/guanylate cyclase domain-containing protein [Candidatus Nitrosotalea sp.]